MNYNFYVGWRGIMVCLAGGYHLSYSTIESLKNDISFCFFSLSSFSQTTKNVGLSSRAMEDQKDQTPENHLNSKKNSVLSVCKSPTPHDLEEFRIILTLCNFHFIC